MPAVVPRTRALLRYFDLALFADADALRWRQLRSALPAKPVTRRDGDGDDGDARDEAETTTAHAILEFYAQVAPHTLPFVILG
jgi:hypothetical protein